MRRLAPRPAGDEGFTIAELAIASFVLVIVVLIAAALLVSGALNQRAVSATTGLSNSSQLAAQSIVASIRDSSAFRVDANGSDQILRARVATEVSGTTTWKCAAWYWDATKKQVRSTVSTSAIATPSTTTLATWTLLLDKAAALGTSSTVFTRSTTALTINMRVTATNATPIDIITAAVSRTGSESWTGDTCFTAP